MLKMNVIKLHNIFIDWMRARDVHTNRNSSLYMPNYNNFCPLKCYDTKMFDHLL